jgi:hypothetical protein
MYNPLIRGSSTESTHARNCRLLIVKSPEERSDRDCSAARGVQISNVGFSSPPPSLVPAKYDRPGHVGTHARSRSADTVCHARYEL